MKSRFGRSAHVSGASAMALALALVMLAGCSSVKLSDVPVETRTPIPVKPGGTGAGTGGTPQSQVTPVDLASGNADANAAGQRVVYFDFDSYVVRDEYRPIIERFARALALDRKKHLRVEGYTDERGGTEYNLALGQKRAEAVEKSLVLIGATDSQIEAVSFGKERPLVQGSDEAAYAKNRRAELTFR